MYKLLLLVYKINIKMVSVVTNYAHIQIMQSLKNVMYSMCVCECSHG